MKPQMYLVEILIFSQYQIFSRPKGQKFLKAIYGIPNSPKKRTKKMKELNLKVLWYPRSKIVCTFFGRIEDTIICFQDFLTFNKMYYQQIRHKIGHIFVTWYSGKIYQIILDSCPTRTKNLKRYLIYKAIASLAMRNLDSTGDAISGLYAWAAENLNKKFRWMKGLVAIAKGRREEGKFINF